MAVWLFRARLQVHKGAFFYPIFPSDSEVNILAIIVVAENLMADEQFESACPCEG
jgi:hypothetical protein